MLGALAVPTTALFWLTELDIVVARLFYFPNHPQGPWPIGEWWLWEAIYEIAPLAGAALATVAALMLGLATVRPRMVRARLGSATLLLTLLIGPGLLVNVVFKDHWGHPRPRQVVGLGGDMAYEPPLKPAFAQAGHSFVCGHCSVGFSLLAFWFILKRRWRRLAWIALVGAGFTGLLVGVARMAAGGHFLSDVLWSGFLVFLSAWFTYYVLLRVPFRIDREAIVWPKRPGRRWFVAAFYVSLTGIIAISTALRTPLRADLAYRPSERALAVTPTALVVKAAGLDLEVHVVEGMAGAFEVIGQARGTGTPFSSVEAFTVAPTPDDPTLTYELVTKGKITKLQGDLQLNIPASFETVHISGDSVRLNELPQNASRLPMLRLEAGTR